LRIGIAKAILARAPQAHNPTTRGLSRYPEVELLGYVADLAAAYVESDVVIVPIRGGGGTRIKVLEAFSYRKPVISTSIGIEGIQVEHGTHLLIGDTPEDFGRHCLDLMRDPEREDALIQAALCLVKAEYSWEALRRILR
jgi:glycosyltransferase involved in cell wall biosynthesis